MTAMFIIFSNDGQTDHDRLWHTLIPSAVTQSEIFGNILIIDLLKRPFIPIN